MDVRFTFRRMTHLDAGCDFAPGAKNCTSAGERPLCRLVLVLDDAINFSPTNLSEFQQVSLFTSLCAGDSDLHLASPPSFQLHLAAISFSATVQYTAVDDYLLISPPVNLPKYLHCTLGFRRSSEPLSTSSDASSCYTSLQDRASYTITHPACSLPLRFSVKQGAWNPIRLSAN